MTQTVNFLDQQPISIGEQLFLTPNSWWHFILNLIAPASCLGCGQWYSVLCPQCQKYIDYHLLPDLSFYLPLQHLDRLYALARYTPPINQLIKQYKYQQHRQIGYFLAELLHRHLVKTEPYDLVTFVPMHTKKQNWRGFNQAEVLATHFSNLRKKTCLPLLVKSKHTASQASSKNKLQRWTKVQGLFQVNPIHSCLDKNVLIIDDVCSTGATLESCAKTLKQAGATKVLGLVIAKND